MPMQISTTTNFMSDWSEEDPELALALQLSKEEALRDEERRKQNKSLDIVAEDMGNVQISKGFRSEGNKIHAIQANTEILG